MAARRSAQPSSWGLRSTPGAVRIVTGNGVAPSPSPSPSPSGAPQHAGRSKDPYWEARRASILGGATRRGAVQPALRSAERRAQSGSLLAKRVLRSGWSLSGSLLQFGVSKARARASASARFSGSASSVGEARLRWRPGLCSGTSRHGTKLSAHVPASAPQKSPLPVFPSSCCVPRTASRSVVTSMASARWARGPSAGRGCRTRPSSRRGVRLR